MSSTKPKKIRPIPCAWHNSGVPLWAVKDKVTWHIVGCNKCEEKFPGGVGAEYHEIPIFKHKLIDWDKIKMAEKQSEDK